MVEMDNHWYYLVRLFFREIRVFRQPYSYLNHITYVIVPKKTTDIPLKKRKAIAEGLKTFPGKYAIGSDKRRFPPDGCTEYLKNKFWEKYKENMVNDPGVPFNLDE